ncbi:MAG: hypothetical protein P1P58_03995 [Treponema sp.]
MNILHCSLLNCTLNYILYTERDTQPVAEAEMTLRPALTVPYQNLLLTYQAAYIPSLPVYETLIRTAAVKRTAPVPDYDKQAASARLCAVAVFKEVKYGYSTV